MPELPEVETVARFLRKNFLNRQITQVTVTDGHLREPVAADYAAQLTGGVLCQVTRHGKYLFLHLSESPAKQVMFHLGMSGRLLAESQPQPHERIRLQFEHRTLLFVYPRRFGFSRAGADVAKNLTLGPDALQISLSELQKALRSRREIKEVLMMQDRLAGIGNIYACEILFVAKVHPMVPAAKLSQEKIYVLKKAINRVLREAIRRKGSSISDFYYGSSKQGGYQNYFKVYDREGLPCKSCASPIHKIRQHGRSTWFCPRCQVR